MVKKLVTKVKSSKTISQKHPSHDEIKSVPYKKKKASSFDRNHEFSANKLAHRNAIYSKEAEDTTSSDQKPNTPIRLLLRNLPPSIDYSALKDKVSDTQRIQLYKKGSKRYAFVTYPNSDLCKADAKKLKRVVIDGFPIRVTEVSSTIIDNVPEPEIIDSSCTLTISNLPFAITKAQLDEEFPTASSIIMNVNKLGRFRGSCLLQFDSLDDCQICSDSCRGRKIGGRLIKVRPGAHFEPRTDVNKQPHSSKPAHFGVKVTTIPITVEEKDLESLFTGDQLLRIKISSDCDNAHKTAVLSFSSQDYRQAALSMFNREKLFGKQLRARPWTFHSNRLKCKPLNDPYSMVQINKQSTEGALKTSGKVHKNKQKVLVHATDAAESSTSVSSGTSNVIGKKHMKEDKPRTPLKGSSGNAVQSSFPILSPVKQKTPTHKRFTSDDVDESSTATFNSPARKTPIHKRFTSNDVDDSPVFSTNFLARKTPTHKRFRSDEMDESASTTSPVSSRKKRKLKKTTISVAGE